tara:strand:- start:1199 stop:2242 length:1044 start_codon:yes stop_codon:yes gene_type:complete
MIHKSKYRISILAPFPPLSGGMTQIAESLARNLNNDGHEVHRIQLGKGLQGLLPIPRLYFQFIKVFLKCDIIHIISASGNALLFKDLPAVLLSRILKKKVILNFVGGIAIEQFQQWPWYKRLPFRFSDIVVLPTDILKDVIKNNEPNFKVIKIPHVVDIKYFHVENILKNDKPILLAAKSLESYSGFDILIDIFFEIKLRFKNAELWIVGDGPQKNYLLNKVRMMNLNSVQFLGNINHRDMPSIMKKATLFVHGTRYESFGIALVEAMASSLPVVSFKVGGIPEVVIDKKMGYLIPYKDKTKFMKAVSDLICDYNKRKEFGENARNHSQNFSWDVIKLYWYELYKKL